MTAHRCTTTHHAACDCREAAHAEDVTQLRADLARVTAERDIWQSTCGELRLVESRISGAIADARDVPMGDHVEAVRALVRERDDARASLAEVRRDLDTMIRVHDEVEARAVAAEAVAEERRERAKRAEAERDDARAMVDQLREQAVALLGRATSAEHDLDDARQLLSGRTVSCVCGGVRCGQWRVDGHDADCLVGIALRSR
jgi:chromosome segregation ATPase